MEMIIPNHSICYFYYDFSVFVFIILFGSIRKIMSYRVPCKFTHLIFM